MHATLSATRTSTRQSHVHGEALSRQCVALDGPSNADVPDVLTFSGTQYFASGRITALALEPNCGQGHCRLYVGGLEEVSGERTRH